jgi:hypothetical protein
LHQTGRWDMPERPAMSQQSVGSRECRIRGTLRLVSSVLRRGGMLDNKIMEALK